MKKYSMKLSLVFLVFFLSFIGLTLKVSATAATVETYAATKITKTSATLNGMVKLYNGEYSIKEYGFYYNIRGSGNYTKVKVGSVIDKGVSFSTTISVQPGTGYSYYAYAINTNGEQSSPQSIYFDSLANSTPTPTPTQTPAKPSAPVISSPKEGDIVNKSTSTFRVSWGAVKNAAIYYVTIRKNGTGSNIYPDQGNAGTANTYMDFDTSKLEYSTNYVVLVSAQSSNGTTSEQSAKINFKASNLSAPSITSPKEGTIIIKGNGTFRVSWTTVKDAGTYYVSIRKNGEGSNIYPEGNNGTYNTYWDFNLSKLEYGASYTVHVTAQNNSSTSDESQKVRFTVADKPSAPVISSPKEGDIVSKSNSTFRVAWGAVKNASLYYVSVRKNGTGSNIYLDQGNSGTDKTYMDFDTSKLEYGVSYTVHVSAQDSNANTSDISTLIHFTASKLPVPSITSPKEGDIINKDNNTFQVSWNAVKEAAIYYVSVRKNGEGNNIYPEKGNGGTGNTYMDFETNMLDYGASYTVHISYQDSNGNTSDKSTVIHFTAAKLATPVISSPKEGEVISKKNPNFKVSWNVISGASTYYVSIRKNGQGNNIYPEKGNQGTSETFMEFPTDRLEEGISYTVHVTAQDYKGNGSDESKKVKFIVEKSNLDAPSITSPDNGDEVDMNDAIIQWKTVTGASNYEVIITDKTEVKDIVDEQISGLSFTIPQDKLTSGHEYKVSLKALAQGKESIASEITFRIKDVQNIELIEIPNVNQIKNYTITAKTSKPDSKVSIELGEGIELIEPMKVHQTSGNEGIVKWDITPKGDVQNTTCPVKVILHPDGGDDIEKNDNITIGNIYSPQKDGYNFTNSSESFGYPSDYKIPLDRYKQVFGSNTMQWPWEVWQIFDEVWGGSCFGMSATSILFDNGGLNKAIYQNNAAFTSELNMPGNKDSDLTSIIENFHIRQFCADASAEIFRTWNINLSSLVNTVQNILTPSNDMKEQPIILCIYGTVNNSNGGHAIVPWKLESTGSQTYNLYVYDCNYPQDKERIIKIDLNNHTWSYEIFKNVYWGSDRPNGHIAYVSMPSINKSLPLNTMWKNNMMNVYVNSVDKLKIKDERSLGELSVINNSYTTNIIDAYMNIPLNLPASIDKFKEAKYKTFILPSSSYTIDSNKELKDVLFAGNDKFLLINSTNPLISVSGNVSTGKTTIIPAQDGTDINILYNKYDDMNSSTLTLSGNINKSVSLDLTSNMTEEALMSSYKDFGSMGFNCVSLHNGNAEIKTNSINFSKLGSNSLSFGFTDETAVSLKTYEWDFNNDGITDSKEQNPDFDFKNSGNYKVSCKVYDDNGIDVYFKDVKVEVPKVLLGDINLDGAVKPNDFAILRDYVIGKIKTLTDEQLKAADVNGDGKVKPNDFAILRDYVIGKIKKFPDSNQ